MKGNVLKDTPDPPIVEIPLTRAARISQQKHATWLIIFSGVITVSFLLKCVGPESVSLGGVRLPEFCTWKRFTGWNCPGCGLTRSFISMADAKWKPAWDFHAAGPLWFTIFLAQIPYRFWQLARLRHGKSEFQTGFEWHLAAVMLGTLIVGWAYRLVVP